MDKNQKVLLTGSTGMVGSAMKKQLGHVNLLTPSRNQLDLCDAENVNLYFSENRPDYVLMIAAKVGGIKANKNDQVGFMTENLQMQLNLFNACHKYRTKKNLFLGSSCIYPRNSEQPIKEEYLLKGELEPTNEGYALAKIVGLKLAKFYFEQHGMVTVCPMPCNIYGTNDHFDLNRSHVLSALVRRFVDAKDAGISSLTLWGSGKARREFIHVDDVVGALLLALEKCNTPEIINIGVGTDITIKRLAEMIAMEVNFEGEILWDISQPDGMLRKCLDISRLNELGFKPLVGLAEGIRRTVNEYRQLKAAGQII